MNGLCVSVAVTAALFSSAANGSCWVVDNRVERTAWVVTQSPACRCDDCPCEVCQCGLTAAVAQEPPGYALAMLDPCAGGPCADGSCDVSAHGAAAHVSHHSHYRSVTVVAGQPMRNGLRVGVGLAGAAARGVGAMARGTAAVMTVRYRARQNHGGPFPLYRAWRCRRGRCCG